MANRRGLKNTGAVVLATVMSSCILMFAEGCNSSQAPDRQVSDSQITTQVKVKLASDVRPSSLTNIDVNTTNGVVILAGQVESSDVKRSAETVAAAVPGVVQVDDNLQVAPPAGSANR
jgi:hyperosmotically inducible periplasmic protein